VQEDRDLIRAREIVQAFECSPEVSASVRCPACTEENPSSFQLCWSCGKSLG
jgi:hypothetical protein